VRILQLVSDWKWTGPAEPMLVLTRALRARGHEVELACPGPPPDANRSLWEEACRRHVAPFARLARGRGALQLGDRAEVARIARWLRPIAGGHGFDVVHCWHGRDHVLAARALGRKPPRRRGIGHAALRSASDPGSGPRLVRSWASAEPAPSWPWNRWLLGPGCDGLLCVSQGAVERHRRLRGGRPIAGAPGAVEADRLMPVSAWEGAREARAMRAALGVAAEAPLIGVVARIQRHRRFDLLLAAMQRLVRQRPDARLVLIGRGTHAEAVAREPVRRLGLEGQVVFAGYRVSDYATLLRTLDVFCFLVPGSDGSCRALLEAATVGLPLVGSRRGAIPEIVRDGVTGWLVEEDPDLLAEAWRALLADRIRRRAWGLAAARDARLRFAPERLAEVVEGFYESVVDGPSREASSRMPTSSR